MPAQKGDRGDPSQSFLVADIGDPGPKGQKGEFGDKGYENLKLVLSMKNNQSIENLNNEIDLIFDILII